MDVLPDGASVAALKRPQGGSRERRSENGRKRSREMQCNVRSKRRVNVRRATKEVGKRQCACEAFWLRSKRRIRITRAIKEVLTAPGKRHRVHRIVCNIDALHYNREKERGSLCRMPMSTRQARSLLPINSAAGTHLAGHTGVAVDEDLF